METLVKVATPPEALTVVVPPKAAPVVPVPLVIERAIDALLFTRFPNWSCTLTVNVGIVEPACMLPGCAAKVNLFAVAALTVNAAVLRRLPPLQVTLLQLLTVQFPATVGLNESVFVSP